MAPPRYSERRKHIKTRKNRGLSPIIPRRRVRFAPNKKRPRFPEGVQRSGVGAVNDGFRYRSTHPTLLLFAKLTNHFVIDFNFVVSKLA